ncbi:MAG: hypothetical protein Q8L81_14295 [Bacteroidota bacterium]|nr:hypothetical protein [Bacteroidota bacterium]
MDYSQRAAQYGYKYRTEYEKQVRDDGKVHTMYSLLDPANELQWLAAVVLSGVAGNLVYDVIKYVAKQIRDRLTEKSKTIELQNFEKDTFEIVADEKTLNQFISYIQAYYKGNKIDNQVSDAIAEEEIVHSMTSDKAAEFMAAITASDDQEEIKNNFLEVFKEGAKIAAKKKWKERPNYKQLENLFRTLKQDSKAERKAKKKLAKKTIPKYHKKKK